MKLQVTNIDPYHCQTEFEDVAKVVVVSMCGGYYLAFYNEQRECVGLWNINSHGKTNTNKTWQYLHASPFSII